jgi:hypothetical protein
MNERIRQLAKDADLDWHTHWNDDESNRLAKFARLIVKECAVFSMVITDDHYDVDALYKHFGVAE